jgi:hypothetical protein
MTAQSIDFNRKKMSTLNVQFRWLRALFVTLCFLGLPFLAQAHLISAGNASIALNPNRTILLVGVPASVFKGIDENQDGLLQPNEIKENRLQMIAQLEKAFQLKIGNLVG